MEKSAPLKALQESVLAVIGDTYAHTPGEFGPPTFHTLREHSLAVAGEMRRLLPERLKDIGEAMGLLHDIGKKVPAFQEMLNLSFHDVGVPVGRVDHKSAGALIFHLAGVHGNQKTLSLLSQILYGHHSKIDDPIKGRTLDLVKNPPRVFKNLAKLVHDVVGDRTLVYVEYKVLYASLVRADCEDTRYYKITAEKAPEIDLVSLTSSLADQVHRRQQEFVSTVEDTPRNRDRKNFRLHVLQSLQESIDEKVFSINGPTGMGKMRTAYEAAFLKAKHSRCSGVYYMPPYNAILHQAMKTSYILVGRDMVLGDYTSLKKENKLGGGAAWEEHRNLWDVPLVNSTPVQFYESLLANTPNKSKKIASLPNKVIILDEPQSYPDEYYNLFLTCMHQLVDHCNCYLIYTSATLPPLGCVGNVRGFEKVIELAPDPQSNAYMKNTSSKYEVASVKKAVLPEDSEDAETQRLIIFNTRKRVHHWYQVSKHINKVYLTTYLTPSHIARVIEYIDQTTKAGAPIFVYSTPIIEAGVDLSFKKEGARSLSSLSSCIQTDGRLDRTKENEDGSLLYIFRDEDDMSLLRVDKSFGSKVSLTSDILEQQQDIFDSEVWDTYAQRLYGQNMNIDARKEGQDLTQVVDSLESSAAVNVFELLASVQLIDDIDKNSVLIPVEEEAIVLLKKLRAGLSLLGKRVFLEVSKHCVKVNDTVCETLLMMGYIEKLEGLQDMYVLLNAKNYSPETGLAMAAEL